ncbi:MAG TPA: DUF4405 domain-containing protein [bacterium]|nr:DUF4405 domain-containing protein [bacterium]
MLEWALEIITKEKTMIKFKFRGFTSFLMFFSFLISLVSGIVLYFPPQGKIAHWTHWTFWGLDKEMWGFLHINSSLVFFVIAILHLYYNWKVLFRYAKKKAVMAFNLKWELFAAIMLVIFVIAATLFNIEPFRTIVRWNEEIKTYWAEKEEAEPPLAHAEDLTVAEFCERLKISIESFQQAARTHGWKFESTEERIEEIARRSGTSPAKMYHRLVGEGLRTSGQRTSGWGRKSVLQVCQENQIEVDVALQRLAAEGIGVSRDELIRSIAGEYGLQPIAVVRLITGEGQENTQE